MKNEREGFFSKTTASRLFLLASLLAAVLTLKTYSPAACAWFSFARAQVESSKAYRQVFAMAEKLREGEPAVQVLGNAFIPDDAQAD